MFRLYNEAMGKNLADKYSHLSNQLDKIVSDANSEIQNLQNKIKGTLVSAPSPTRIVLTVIIGFQVDQKTLQQKNVELVEMYREKSKKQAQTQHLYDTLKKRVMTSQVQTAASDSVTKAISSMSNIPRPQTYGDASALQPTAFRANDPTDKDQYHRPHHSRSPSHSGRNVHGELRNTAMAPPSGPAPMARHHDGRSRLPCSPDTEKD